jgi:sarcosine oxidase subunit beta
MQSASVVIVGGGVIGASIAFHLGEAGVENVLLLERGELGSGSTSKGAGGVRAMFSDELNVRIALRSLEAWAAFGERPGWEIDLHQVGYLFLLSSDAEVTEFERSVEMQNRLGVPSRMVSVDEAHELSPLAGLEGVLAGAFCPLGGHATPEGAVQGYASAARAHKVRIETHTSVTGIEGTVVTAAGPRGGRAAIETECVVCAAGPWSREVGAMAGVELAVRPEKRRIAYTGPIAELAGGAGGAGAPAVPMTIDFATGFYFHREGPGLLFGTSDVCDTQDEWLERAVPVLGRRAPILLDAPIAGGWWGDYEMTPDHNALIGEAPPGRFLYATGFSGHGFQQAPAVGEIVRDLYLGKEPFVAVSPLSAGRQARRERNVV